MPLTDLKLLQILLNLPCGKLTRSEKRAFQAMFDDLSNGKRISLSPKQRAWAMAVYQKYGLHIKGLPRLRQIATKDKNPGPRGSTERPQIK